MKEFGTKSILLPFIHKIYRSFNTHCRKGTPRQRESTNCSSNIELCYVESLIKEA